MCLIAHAIRLKCLENGVSYRIGIGHSGKCEGLGRVLQPLQVAAERSNSTVIDTQSFPHGVAALHDAVEDRYPGFASLQQAAIDIHQNILVSWIR